MPLEKHLSELLAKGQTLIAARAAGAAEPDPDSFPALVSGGTNDSLWVGPTKTRTKTSLREQGGPFGTALRELLASSLEAGAKFPIPVRESTTGTRPARQ